MSTTNIESQALDEAMTDEEIQPVISWTLAFVERETVNPQLSLLNFTLEAGISGDVMWSLIDSKILEESCYYSDLQVCR